MESHYICTFRYRLSLTAVHKETMVSLQAFLSFLSRAHPNSPLPLLTSAAQASPSMVSFIFWQASRHFHMWVPPGRLNAHTARRLSGCLLWIGGNLIVSFGWTIYISYIMAHYWPSIFDRNKTKQLSLYVRLLLPPKWVRQSECITARVINAVSNTPRAGQAAIGFTWILVCFFWNIVFIKRNYIICFVISKLRHLSSLDNLAFVFSWWIFGDDCAVRLVWSSLRSRRDYYLAWVRSWQVSLQ